MLAGFMVPFANGTVVAIFDDYPVLGYAISNGEAMKLVGEPEKGASYGFAVKKRPKILNYWLNSTLV